MTQPRRIFSGVFCCTTGSIAASWRLGVARPTGFRNSVETRDGNGKEGFDSLPEKPLSGFARKRHLAVPQDDCTGGGVARHGTSRTRGNYPVAAPWIRL